MLHWQGARICLGLAPNGLHDLVPSTVATLGLAGFGLAGVFGHELKLPVGRLVMLARPQPSARPVWPKAHALASQVSTLGTVRLQDRVCADFVDLVGLDRGLAA